MKNGNNKNGNGSRLNQLLMAIISIFATINLALILIIYNNLNDRLTLMESKQVDTQIANDRSIRLENAVITFIDAYDISKDRIRNLESKIDIIIFRLDQLKE
ncbi:MAG: hypothetical protein AABY07_03260 [Nanoarchaeota archaeon]